MELLIFFFYSGILFSNDLFRMLMSAYHQQWMQLSSLANISNIPPDITLILEAIDDAEPTTFFAHRSVLGRHSGYFQTLLSTYNGLEVRLSNIRPQIFSLILVYMYTAEVEINFMNVYEILLASTSLQITSIVDKCRQYLHDDQRSYKWHSTSIIKPVPRKTTASVSNLFQTYESMKYQPLRINEKVPSIFKPVRANISQSSPEPNIQSGLRLSRSNVVHDKKSKIKDDIGREVISNHDLSEENDAALLTNKVVYDIACCDGPIQFRKVVNQFYNPKKSFANRGCDEHTTSSQNNCHDCRNATEFRRPQKCQIKTCNFKVKKNDNHEVLIDTNGELLRTTSAIKNITTNTNSNIKSSIQYYSCKSCGSKFPSYYFVNKHRKLCHINDRCISEPNDE